VTDLSGYIVVLPNIIIDIPLTSNLSWLPLFYALPPELVNKQKKYESLPRNINVLLSSPEYIKLIEDDVFLQLVWDSYAWSIWQFLKIPLRDGSHRDIPGDWSDYSGNFPLWRLCYYLQLHFRDKFEHEMEFSFQRLFMMPDDVTVPWLDYKHFGNLIGNLTDLIIKEQNMQPTIDMIWQNRQVEDYTKKDTYARKDFMKHWTHVRKDGKVKGVFSLEKLLDVNEEIFASDKERTDITDDAVKKISIEDFKKSLSDEEKLILKMRAEGKTLGEIAAAVGLKSPSAITKRIAKLADQYRTFVD